MLQLIILIITLVLSMLYINTLSKTAHAISFLNREIDPISVWYLMIPVYNYFYYFIVVSRLSRSIYAEFNHRNIPTDDKPAYLTGVLTDVFFVLNAVMALLKYADISNEIVNGIISLIGIIIWITYWIQINQYKRQIEALPPLTVEEGAA